MPNTPRIEQPIARRLDEADPRLLVALERLTDVHRPRHRRLWTYYRNPITPRSGAESSCDRPYRQGQEWGLPARITGVVPGGEIDAPRPKWGAIARKEIVIENDIAWRIDTGVDYLFGRDMAIESGATDPDRKALLTAVLDAILERHGGMAFFQQLALIGAVCGFVDVLVKFDPTGTSGTPGTPAGADDIERLAGAIRLEIVEPARAAPVLVSDDWRTVELYARCHETARPTPAPPRDGAVDRGWIDRLRRSASAWLGQPRERRDGARVGVVEVLSATDWRRYEDGRLIAAGGNSLGRIPLVHIQNIPLPFSYAGLGDVEPLIPLQDELNTRLSDRANRIALQSFKMYLGKGIEGFVEQPVAPGRMWMTDNPDAEVLEFGGDAHCPSEESHIADLREAMDKASAVTPIAAGAIKNRIGRLSSAAALRITLLALLSKTDRKRFTYGAGVQRICELALAWLDRAGWLASTPSERRVELHWQSALPENDAEKLDEAAAKLRVGVAPKTVLRELGYAENQGH